VAVETAKRRVQQVLITFNKPVAGAGNAASYALNLLSMGRRQRTGTRPTGVGRALAISSASYDASTNQATLTLRAPLRTNQLFQLRVVSGSAGITDASGNALNSPSGGTAANDFIYDIN
jgi:hypothetical protein